MLFGEEAEWSLASNEDSIIRLVRSVLMEQNDGWPKQRMHPADTPGGLREGEPSAVLAPHEREFRATADIIFAGVEGSECSRSDIYQRLFRLDCHALTTPFCLNVILDGHSMVAYISV